MTFRAFYKVCRIVDLNFPAHTGQLSLDQLSAPDVDVSIILLDINTEWNERRPIMIPRKEHQAISECFWNI